MSTLELLETLAEAIEDTLLGEVIGLNKLSAEDRTKLEQARKALETR